MSPLSKDLLVKEAHPKVPRKLRKPSGAFGRFLEGKQIGRLRGDLVCFAIWKCQIVSGPPEASRIVLLLGFFRRIPK